MTFIDERSTERECETVGRINNEEDDSHSSAVINSMFVIGLSCLRQMRVVNVRQRLLGTECLCSANSSDDFLCDVPTIRDVTP